MEEDKKLTKGTALCCHLCCDERASNEVEIGDSGEGLATESFGLSLLQRNVWSSYIMERASVTGDRCRCISSRSSRAATDISVLNHLPARGNAYVLSSGTVDLGAR